ncbi:MAG: hypothetical protein A3G34_05360 [Candidatus Lindowbacteria bacterium RIFCSPLOWO2_12_FULL_62_27]|nr:MAG: hypothetical protein A3G34_05360 [Candidatus Lindowbacteria bacterium RIFCSPLOWO2_12_FULL_62_27]OGH63924.1 MAG: hypothetical protein A3I06_03785 [Candidatus Lindowbacteria bacterium RIFCSPLOWO2_02_FULL_62_12]
MPAKSLTAAALHLGLAVFFRNDFYWYGRNCVDNPYYDFSLFFVAGWWIAEKLRPPKQVPAGHPAWGAALAVVAWGCYLTWKGPYLGMASFLLTSILLLRFLTPGVSRRVDGLYCAVLFTMPFPFYAEFLSILQLFAQRASLGLMALMSAPLSHEGSLVHLKDGPVRVAAACSGFQSLIVLFAISALLAHLLELNFARKFMLIAFSIVSSIAFNVLRVTAMLGVGQAWGVDTAVKFWHGPSAWIFYLMALGSLVWAGAVLKRRRR